MRHELREFVTFIREKGVLGLAIGIIMGGAVSKLVNAIVEDLVNPALGIFSGSGGGLATLAYTVPFTQITFKWGDFLSNLIEFVAILAVIYVVFVKTPIIRDIDRKKEDK